MKVEFIPATLSDVREGVVFRFTGPEFVNPDDFYLALGPANDGGRNVVNLGTGKLTRNAASSPVAAYPEADLIVKDRS